MQEIIRQSICLQHLAHADGCICRNGCVVQQLQHLGMDQVVAVHKAKPVAFAISHSMISGCCLSPVFLVDH